MKFFKGSISPLRGEFKQLVRLDTYLNYPKRDSIVFIRVCQICEHVLPNKAVKRFYNIQNDQHHH